MDVSAAIMLYNANRLKFYTSLSTFGTFGKGWTNRVANNLELGVKS